MGNTKEGKEKERRKGKKAGIHLVLRPGDEPNKTDNRPTAGHGTDLDTPNCTGTSTRRKLRIFYKYTSKPSFESEKNISNSQESEKETQKHG